MSSVVSGFVYLASQSPRRFELLAQIGVHCKLLLAEAGEDAEALERPLAAEAPEVYVERVTRLKLAAARDRHQLRGLAPAPIVCADTIVILDGKLLGKPADAAAARATLARLSGRTHRVLTAVAVGVPAGGDSLAVQISHVRFAAVQARQIERYVASGEPFGKAGAYAIQGAAAAWIDHIEGSHSAIMGLPLHETALLLRHAGIDV